MRRLINLIEAKTTLPLAPTPKNIAIAKRFVLRKWEERKLERGAAEPHDLSDSCKFSSLFAQRIFGGRLRGNEKHQYVSLGGSIIDLNADAADVQDMKHPYRHDPVFWGNTDHVASMRSCIPRVDQWIEEFLAETN